MFHDVKVVAEDMKGTSRINCFSPAALQKCSLIRHLVLAGYYHFCLPTVHCFFIWNKLSDSRRPNQVELKCTLPQQFGIASLLIYCVSNDLIHALGYLCLCLCFASIPYNGFLLECLCEPCNIQSFLLHSGLTVPCIFVISSATSSSVALDSFVTVTEYAECL